MSEGHSDGAIDVKSFKLTVETFDSFAAAEAIRAEWDDFVLATKADIHLSFDWCRIWWNHYGYRRRLRLFAIRNGENLVGIVPMFMEMLWLGPVWLKVAKMVGSDPHTLSTLPIQPEWGSFIVSYILEQWLCYSGCDAVWFGKISGCDHSIDSIYTASQSLTEVDVVRDDVVGVYQTFILPATFTEYIGSIHERERRYYRSDTKMLARSFKIESDVITEAEKVPKEFESFLCLHAQRWQRDNQLGHFGDWPQAAAFNRDMVIEQAKLGRTRLYRFMADGKVVSYQYAFRFGPNLFWQVSARAVGDPWDRCGLGRTSIIKMFEYAIAEGIRRVEAGLSKFEYKSKLGAQEYSVRSVLVASSRGTSWFRARVFAALSRALTFTYYRLWFARIAPKLPFRKRPILNLWIRCSFD